MKSKKLILIIGVLILLIFLVFIESYISRSKQDRINLLNQETITENVTEDSENRTEITNSVISSLSQKYKKSEAEIVIVIDQNTNNYAKGSVNFTDDPGGGIWFAAKNNNSWELVWDGNGIITCETIENYDFPAEMIPQCLDTENESQLVER